MNIRSTGCAALLAIFAILASPVTALAETRPTVKNIGVEKPATFLFVGNSFMYYNNSLHNHFGRLVRAAEEDVRPNYRATSATVSGSSLSWHDVESYFRPGALAEFSFVADNQIRFNDFDRLFDVVIMMDCSRCPIHPQLQDRFHQTVAKHSATARKNGALPALFMTWAYEDKPEMTAMLAEQYTRAGNKNDALVIPAGLAFAKARSKQAEIKLYTPDKRHPSLEGTYLAALTVYASIYRKSPLGSTPAAGIDAATATFLQEVAWETVEEYFAE